jgi:hypothetical protein
MARARSILTPSPAFIRPIHLQEDTVSNSDGHAAAPPASWIAVFLIVAAFIAGTCALIVGSVALWIVTGVLAVIGITLAFTSKIMEHAY